MAQTIDTLTLKVNVSGQAQVDELNTSLEQTGKTANTVKGKYGETTMAVRNFSYQIQDMAVQLEMGTDVMRVMGQQLPQMLGSFGTLGIVIGALAAVGLPLLRSALKAAGVDLKDLDDKIQDYVKSVDASRSAHEIASQSLATLRIKYGDAADEVKKYYDQVDRVNQQVARSDLAQVVEELSKKYKDLGFRFDLTNAQQNAFYGDAISGMALYNLYQDYQAKKLGLTAEKSAELGQKFKQLNGSLNKEELLAILTQMLVLLEGAGGAAGKFSDDLKAAIKQITDIGGAATKSEENIKGMAQAATDFNAKVMGIETGFVAGIGAAKRAYDQAGAARLATAQKIAVFEAQARNSAALEGISKEKEIAAFRVKAYAELSQQLADIKNAQDETFRSAENVNKAKTRQTELEAKILGFRDSMRGQLSYEITYAEDLARSAKERADTETNIAEQLRKQAITQQQALSLSQQAKDAEAQANANAELRRKNAIEDSNIRQETALLDLKYRNDAIKLDIQSEAIRQQMRNAYPEDIATIIAMNKLKEEARIAEEKINREVELGNITREQGDKRIKSINEGLQLSLDLERMRNEEVMRRKTGTAVEGMDEGIRNILKQGQSAFEMAQAGVDSVFNNMNRSIDEFVNTGKFKFSDFARSIIADLIKIQLKAAVINFLGLIFPSLKPTLSGIPGKAIGGPVTADMPYIVGERGPELFVPRTGGTITPNSQLGGTTQVIYNIQAVDARSFKELVAQDPEFIYSVTRAGARRIPR